MNIAVHAKLKKITTKMKICYFSKHSYVGFSDYVNYAAQLTEKFHIQRDSKSTLKNICNSFLRLRL